jgi:hypothetical protein
MQLFSPETNAFKVGYGFWLLVLISSSFIGIGAVGFIYRVLSVVYSAEYRSALASRNLTPQDQRLVRSKQKPPPPMVPNLQAFTDSPGVRLTFRLPEYRPETRQLVLASLFVLAWDALAVLLVGVAFGKIARGRPDWFLTLFAAPLFAYIGFRVSRWFFQMFRRATGIGQTTIEVDDLPLQAGQAYELNLVQYGRLWDGYADGKTRSVPPGSARTGALSNRLGTTSRIVVQVCLARSFDAFLPESTQFDYLEILG